ncbi:MAG: hypothetical protein U0U70_15805 [Chitinophagaceae bacterium]
MEKPAAFSRHFFPISGKKPYLCAAIKKSIGAQDLRGGLFLQVAVYESLIKIQPAICTPVQQDTAIHLLLPEPFSEINK